MKISKQKGGGGIVILIIFGLIVWGVISLFSGSRMIVIIVMTGGSVFIKYTKLLFFRT